MLHTVGAVVTGVQTCALPIYSFRPWSSDQSIADGPSILEYIRETARLGGIDTKIRFNHRVVAADWSSDDARWHITAERSDPSRPDAAPARVELTAGFIFSCRGYYRYDKRYQPKFPGMDRSDKRRVGKECVR